MTIVKKAAAAIAVLSLVACSTMSNMMGGGSSVKAHLTGAEEVPPVSTSAMGDANFTVGKDGSVKGSVTTTGMQGTTGTNASGSANSQQGNPTNSIHDNRVKKETGNPGLQTGTVK